MGDEQRVVELLKCDLEEPGYQVELTYDEIWGSCLFCVGELQMVISDVILPKMSDFELCKGIQNINNRVPVLMLTALDATDDKLDGFDTGIDDYMVKPFDFHEPDTRIKVLPKRWLPSISEAQLTELAYADLRIGRQTKTVYRQEREIKLSPEEYDLLLYMAENPKRLLTRVEIADKVWNTRFNMGTNFINMCINYLRKKIDRDYDVKLICTKSGTGFMFRQEL